MAVRAYSVYHDSIRIHPPPGPAATPLFKCAASAASLLMSTRCALLPSKPPRMLPRSQRSHIDVILQLIEVAVGGQEGQIERCGRRGN